MRRRIHFHKHLHVKIAYMYRNIKFFRVNTTYFVKDVPFFGIVCKILL